MSKRPTVPEPEETPANPRPEMPGYDQSREQPEERPPHPYDPEGGGGRPVVEPEALAIRIP